MRPDYKEKQRADSKAEDCLPSKNSHENYPPELQNSLRFAAFRCETNNSKSTFLTVGT